MVIVLSEAAQGEVYWVDLGEPVGSSPGFRHPCVVIQSDALNRSRLATVVVCVLTSNLKRAGLPGNVLLERREAGLSKSSVVIVSQIFTVDRTQLVAKIGKLSKRRLLEILAGVQLVLEPVGF